MSVADKAMASMLKNLLGVDPEQIIQMLNVIYQHALDVKAQMNRIEQKVDARNAEPLKGISNDG